MPLHGFSLLSSLPPLPPNPNLHYSAAGEQKKNNKQSKAKQINKKLEKKKNPTFFVISWILDQRRKTHTAAFMASATARPTFSFHLQTSNSQPSSPTRLKTHLTFPSPHPKKSLISHLLLLHTRPRLQFTSNSIDVSQEDKSISETSNPTSISPEPFPLEGEEKEVEEEEEDKFDKRRIEEQFAVLNTGISECKSCGYLYNEASGDPSYPIPPGLPFNKLPEDWRCPTCGAAQSFFQNKSVEIAGFAQNQQFGLGGNTLTSGQKLIIIYGTLFFFFVLFLSGYFLQ